MPAVPTDLTQEQFYAMFNAATSTIFRLETLQQYLVDAETERFKAFRDGRPMPGRTEAGKAWLRQIADRAAAGVRWSRVHVVDDPLTDYIKFELLGYKTSAAAGYDTFIAERAAHPDLSALVEDFYLFDAELPSEALVLMRYDAEGHWLGAARLDDDATIQRCRRQRDLAMAHAVPLADFLAARRGEVPDVTW